MSTLLGNPGDPWPLSRAVDALTDSARRGGIPGLIWIAGIFYPSLQLNYELVQGLLSAIEHATEIRIQGANPGAGALLFSFAPSVIDIQGSLAQRVVTIVVLLPLMLVWYRLIVGLARVSDPKLWEDATPDTDEADTDELAEDSTASAVTRPRSRRRGATLRSVWRAGKGLSASALGMWLMLLGLLFGTMLFLIGPLVTLVRILGLEEFSTVFGGLVLPVMILLVMYAVVLQVVNQLALHSLAHNRRGVASALIHAWRLLRNSPWGAARATLVDLSLFAMVFVAASLIRSVLGGGFTAEALALCLAGFAGVTRAGFWARTYRGIGGLSSADAVPGL